MNIDKVHQRMKGGFKPFMIRMSDGREYGVPHPEFILVGRSEIVVTDREGEIQILDPLHITALKTLAAKKNGAN
jgi:hypothetical protein